MSREILILSEQDVRECLARMNTVSVLDLVESVLCAHGQGQVIMPPKLNMNLASKGIQGWMNAMPSYVAPGKLMGLKWVGGFSENPSSGLPYIMGLIVLADARSGLLVSLMEGSQITSLRTGAAAGIAAKYLAPRGSVAVGLIGAGMQGSSALFALGHAIDIATVAITDTDGERAEKLAARFNAKFGQRAVTAKTPEDAVKKAEVIVTATPVTEPVVRGTWPDRGSLIIALGSYQEVESSLVTTASKIVVDNWEQAQHRGSLAIPVERGLITRDRIWGELGDIVAGKLPGRESSDEHIVCCQVGMGSEDLAVASRVFEIASEANMGVKVPFYDN